MKLSLSTRIFLGFIVVVLAFGAASVYTVIRMTELQRSVTVVWQEVMPVSTDLKELSRRLRSPEEFLTVRRPSDQQWIERLLPRVDPFRHLEEVETRLDAIASNPQLPSADVAPLAKVAERLRTFRKGPTLVRALKSDAAGIPEGVEAAEESRQFYENLVEIVISRASRGELVKGDPAARAVIRALRRINRAVISASRGVADPIAALNERAASEEKAATMAVMVIGGAALGVSLLMLIMIQLSLRPLGFLRDGVRHIAAGDYSDRVSVRSRDEIGALAGEFNTMAAALEARDEALREQREALVRSERLAMVGKMAAQITHEIRNPLSSIGLNAEMLEDEITEQEGDARPLLGAIQSEVSRLTEITENYLRYARFPNPDLEPSSLSVEVLTCLRFLQPEIHEASIELDAPFELLEGGLAPDVEVDADQLRQAVFNVVRNAMDALRESSEPRVIRARFGVESDTAFVEFTDSGPGLEAEIAEGIFEPFVTGKSGGTGLGLSLTQQIIEAHGGAVRVEAQSEPLGGALFRIELPRIGAFGSASPPS